jgi:predicted tellurium resistance membrane protein TerC
MFHFDSDSEVGVLDSTLAVDSVATGVGLANLFGIAFIGLIAMNASTS